jgi:hypothetical protein
MILKLSYKSVRIEYAVYLSRTRRTNSPPDRTVNRVMRVIVQALAITAEHYKFCRPLPQTVPYTHIRRLF